MKEWRSSAVLNVALIKEDWIEEAEEKRIESGVRECAVHGRSITLNIPITRCITNTGTTNYR